MLSTRDIEDLSSVPVPFLSNSPCILNFYSSMYIFLSCVKQRNILQISSVHVQCSDLYAQSATYNAAPPNQNSGHQSQNLYGNRFPKNHQPKNLQKQRQSQGRRLGSGTSTMPAFHFASNNISHSFSFRQRPLYQCSWSSVIQRFQQYSRNKLRVHQHSGCHNYISLDHPLLILQNILHVNLLPNLDSYGRM